MKLSSLILSTISAIAIEDESSLDDCNVWVDDCREPPREPTGGGTGAYDQFGKDYSQGSHALKFRPPQDHPRTTRAILWSPA